MHESWDLMRYSLTLTTILLLLWLFSVWLKRSAHKGKPFFFFKKNQTENALQIQSSLSLTPKSKACVIRWKNTDFFLILNEHHTILLKESPGDDSAELLNDAKN